MPCRPAVAGASVEVVEGCRTRGATGALRRLHSRAAHGPGAAGLCGGSSCAAAARQRPGTMQQWGLHGCRAGGVEGRAAGGSRLGCMAQRLDNGGVVVERGCLARGCRASAAAAATRSHSLAPAALQAVTGDGYDAILSAPWYLNLGCYATDDWKKYYAGEGTC